MGEASRVGMAEAGFIFDGCRRGHGLRDSVEVERVRDAHKDLSVAAAAAFFLLPGEKLCDCD